MTNRTFPPPLAVDHRAWLVIAVLLEGPAPTGSAYLIGPDQIPGPWVEPAELAARSGLDLETILDVVADLDCRGLVETWEPENHEIVIILSALAAETLDVELDDLGGYLPGLSWVRRSDRRAVPAPRQSGPQAFSLSAFGPEDPALRSRSAGPVESAELAELVEDLFTRSAGRFAPFPKVLLEGVPSQAWREADRLTHTVDRCPACQGKPLPPSWCCLACLRWGSDPRPVEADTAKIRPVTIPMIDRDRRRQLSDRRDQAGRPKFVPRRWEATRKKRIA